ncbi:MAG TPA: tRNA pseudouridine(55) synthase TruB [Blastocatellia bacterium]|nr:tRNA pseudouridine(55) synthase TruB [Blastocatellia bacterium]
MLGALTIDKPEGITSHDVVARVRRATRIRRVGHAGTLDPFATGVLVCCIGPATRLVQFLVGLDKEYEATVRLGYATDTQDCTGTQITPLRPSSELTVDDLRRVLTQFTGAQLQTPPMFSAKKIGGERLYKAAREGRSVEREAVNITVYSIELIEDEASPLKENEDGTRDFRVRLRCSSGTYVRTIAHDIGERLGVGAHLTTLRRTEVGHFTLASALTLDEAERMGIDELNNALISPSQMLAHLPVLVLNEEDVKRVINGRAVALSEKHSMGGEQIAQPISLCDSKGVLVAVGNSDPVKLLVNPSVVLAT